MYEIPLLNKIEEYVEKKMIYFCMPGHKMSRGFMRDEVGRRILDKLVQGDLTEVEGLDNLFNPQEVLKEELKLLKETYGSEKSFFLVNGSTSGNLTMIYSAFDENDKIIIERNCHKSVINGIILRKLDPVYVDCNDYSKYDAPLVPKEEYIIEAINNNKDAKGILLTYPNYYGACFDLERVIDAAHKNGMMILIDCAHGAHFGFNEKLPKSPVELGADMVVMSAHKTLPSFTQTAYLHINNRDLIENGSKYLKYFSSTSPSYMFMMSMAYSRYYLQKYGEEDYEKLINTCDRYREKIHSIKKFILMEMEDESINVDRTRLIIITQKGYSGDKLSDYLLKRGIQPEMSNHRCVVFITSYFNTEEEFEVLYRALEEVDMELIAEESCCEMMIHKELPEIVLKPYEVDNMSLMNINFKEAEGMICGESIVPYPPGVAVVNPGERISRELIDYIEFGLRNGTEFMGVEKDSIRVVEYR